MTDKSLIDQIPNLPQRQDSTHAQLVDLIAVANKLGLYDAADAIQPLVAVNRCRDVAVENAARNPEIVDAIRAGDNVRAVKACRNAFGTSLKDAKRVVETIMKDLGRSAGE